MLAGGQLASQGIARMSLPSLEVPFLSDSMRPTLRHAVDVFEMNAKPAQVRVSPKNLPQMPHADGLASFLMPAMPT